MTKRKTYSFTNPKAGMHDRRETFQARNADLRAEMAVHGEAMVDCDGYRHEVAFLQTHRYLTPIVRALRAGGKQQNLQTVLAQLTNCEVPRE